MSKITLTERTLRRPPPPSGQVEVWDALVPGFGLRISAGGSRTYFVMRRLHGKLVRRSVGKVAPPDGPRGPGELTLSVARARARTMIDALSRGIDPDGGRRRARANGRGDTPRTFGDVAGKFGPPDASGEREWITGAYFLDPSKRGGAKLRSRAELERKVRIDLAAWHDRPIGDITRADVRAVINAKHATSPIAANRLLALIRRIFRWAVREDLIAANPAADIDRPAQESERDRVLGLPELVRIWHGAADLGTPYGPLVKLLILTGQRRSEVAELSWSEIEGASWRLPDERAKRGKGHLIPLSPLAVQILQEMPRVGDPPTLVFTTGKRAARKGEKVDKSAPPAPVSGWSRMKDRLDWYIARAAAHAAKEPGLQNGAGKWVDLKAERKAELIRRYGLEPWTLHDVRRSVATHLRDADIMGEDRVDRLVVSKILNHAEGGMTRIYDRYAADPEKRAALEAWARVIETACGLTPAASNVIPMKGKRA